MRFHTLRLAIIIPIVAASICLTTCGGLFGTNDQTWFVEYVVSNQSSIDLTVRYGSYYSAAYPQVQVAQGKSKRLFYYEEFLGPTPDANRNFTCVSVYRDSDHQLVFQLAPVSNQQWKRRVQQKYHEQYTLELTDTKLHKSAITSRCGEITGVVSDSLTVAPLEGCRILVREESPKEPSYMKSYTNSSGRFFLTWYGGVPQAPLEFSAQGRQCRILHATSEIDSIAPRQYVANIALPPNPLPEDSLRWGSCYDAR